MSVIGIDIGGTNLRALAVASDGRILARANAATAPERGPDATIAELIAMVRGIEAEIGGAAEALGIGVTGPVDPFTGIVTNPFTLGGWPPTDLRTPFETTFGVPVAIDNDANVAAVGEWWLGAGRGYRRLAMVTIGTGIGVASLVGGEVQRAIDGRHGEAGHMLLDPAGPACYCGGRGCWEVLASGTAIARQARQLAWRESGELWQLAAGSIEQVGADLVFEAAVAGDSEARAVIDTAADWIGVRLVNLASAVTPDVFVLAGGVARQLAVMQPRIDHILRRHATMILTDVPVARAALEDDAGPIGAARLALGLAGGVEPA